MDDEILFRQRIHVEDLSQRDKAVHDIFSQEFEIDGIKGVVRGMIVLVPVKSRIREHDSGIADFCETIVIRQGNPWYGRRPNKIMYLMLRVLIVYPLPKIVMLARGGQGYDNKKIPPERKLHAYRLRREVLLVFLTPVAEHLKAYHKLNILIFVSASGGVDPASHLIGGKVGRLLKGKGDKPYGLFKCVAGEEPIKLEKGRN